MIALFVLGPPGAGKTTTMLQFLKHVDFKRVLLTPADVRPELGTILGRQTMEVWISSDGKTAILGKFPPPTSETAMFELAGADLYTKPQRTRLKAVIQHLAETGVEVCVTDGFASINKPFLAQLQETCSTVNAIMLTTAQSTCTERFLKRNVDMWTRLKDPSRLGKIVSKAQTKPEDTHWFKCTHQLLEVVTTSGGWQQACRTPEAAVDVLLGQYVTRRRPKRLCRK
jgi:hypothetical protein